ncbi:hypothetical protein VFPPC_15909 [Pochonia chlamydosporia 170]|uniref:Uncharacterized protein n=1 Tax=Pochonia chlamydosporia 170 TaxID=1380566 RepID=A0A179FTS9_METCM|nr:hypothetical protein VFPPC_15909 [Pochonia chlamydosporia 170]OAQ69012.1 hypothetical protein VFPPC_15909 [Pochonia chlamydosporia 170]
MNFVPFNTSADLKLSTCSVTIRQRSNFTHVLVVQAVMCGKGGMSRKAVVNNFLTTRPCLRDDQNQFKY